MLQLFIYLQQLSQRPSQYEADEIKEESSQDLMVNDSDLTSSKSNIAAISININNDQHCTAHIFILLTGAPQFYLGCGCH